MRIHIFGKLSLMDEFWGGIEEGVLYLRFNLPLNPYLLTYPSLEQLT